MLNTFANNLYPDEAKHFVEPDLDPLMVLKNFLINI